MDEEELCLADDIAFPYFSSGTPREGVGGSRSALRLTCVASSTMRSSVLHLYIFSSSKHQSSSPAVLF
jgi:hypothetical protein